MSQLPERISDLGRMEVKYLLNDSIWQENIPVPSDIQGEVKFSKALTRTMKEAMGWWAEKDSKIAHSLSDKLDDYEAKPADAVIAMEPLTTAVLGVSLTSLASFTLGLWFKVWQTKMAVKTPIEARLTLDEETNSIQFHASGVNFPSGEIPSLDVKNLLGKLKDDGSAAKAIQEILESLQSKT